jgi:excisionase family DNA binding protein
VWCHRSGPEPSENTVVPAWFIDQIKQTSQEVDLMEREVETLFEPLLSHKEAAALLGLNRETLRRMAVRREVPAHKIGRFWKYRRSELDEWFKKK